MSWWKRKKKPQCPHCGSTDQVPIVYGLPTDDTFRRAERREVALGGCIISNDSPTWQCRACGVAWGGRVSGSGRNWRFQGEP